MLLHSPVFLADFRAASGALLGNPSALPRFLSPLIGRVSQASSSSGVKYHQSRAMAHESQAAPAPSIVVYVTVPNKEEGFKLASSIITKKLAACVNQIPGIESTYWWEGKVETDSEVLLIIKTKKSLLDELTAHVIQSHSYKTPEVIALPIQGGNPAYLKWIEESTK
ncbi:protein CutA 1, chloroplastic [Selaginella moellendorffii]|nr:protein CutA 1, chloroplastic [Selaginella moellendorffii]|eukprot:XP_002968158.2 protein CutA 1, chloroplastic [Selaginella moellendorffii]